MKTFSAIALFCWIIFTFLGGLIYKHEVITSSSRTVSSMYQRAFNPQEVRTTTTPITTTNTTTNTTTPAPTGPTQVLLLTYMRSGSSLVGDILQHMPDAFYVYEPLRVFAHYYPDNKTIRYINGTTRAPPYSFNDEAVNLLKHWFTCNISSLQASSLWDTPFLDYGLKTRQYLECTKTMKLISNNSEQNKQVCLQRLQKLCEESPVRVIKTIRLELSAVRGLLEVLPNLKIVHLVRDPRATLLSQLMMARCMESNGGNAGCTNKYCTRVENDVLEEEELNLNQPTRVKTLLYESLARDPIGTSKELYQFCGGDFTTSVEEYIYNITMAGAPDNCPVCTVRSNATAHIDSWKGRIGQDFLHIIQERCNYVLKRYKYEMYYT